MNGQPMRLLWGGNDVPHAVLDISRGCNISCRACYNKAPVSFKPLDEVCRDLDGVLAWRKLDSVAILGGEILLHPQLIEIVRAVRSRDLHVELFSNGLLLDETKVRDLRAAGTDAIFLHIERGQERSDLPNPLSSTNLNRLIAEKAALVARYGMTAGITFTAFKDDVEGLFDALRFAIEFSPVEYVLVTLYRDMQSLGRIWGNLSNGLKGEPARNMPDASVGLLTLDEIHFLMEEELGLLPFAIVPSSRSVLENRWLSYLIGRVTKHGKTVVFRGLQASRFEPLFVRIHRALHGRFPFYQRNGPIRFRLHLLINALAGGKASSNLRLLWDSFFGKASLKSQRIVFQCPAELDAEGRIVHCLDCPDAVLKNDSLVPVCLADQVVK